jgi:hypothetical protein
MGANGEHFEHSNRISKSANQGYLFNSRGIISFSRGLSTIETIKSANNRLRLHNGFSQQ